MAKPNDKITQMILDYNLKDCVGEVSIKEAIKVVTEFKASTKRICVCTDDRDADDLFNFGLDWVVRQARDLGIDISFRIVSLVMLSVVQSFILST